MFFWCVWSLSEFGSENSCCLVVLLKSFWNEQVALLLCCNGCYGPKGMTVLSISACVAHTLSEPHAVLNFLKLVLVSQKTSQDFSNSC